MLLVLLVSYLKILPKTRSRKFTPIYSSRRFIVLDIIFMCSIHLELNFVHRPPFKPCFWKCLSPVSLHMTLNNLSLLPANRVWLVPDENDIRPLAQCTGSAPYQVLLLPGAFQAVTSHQCPRATVSERTGLEPLSSQKEKRCFWSLKLNFQSPFQVHEAL